MSLSNFNSLTLLSRTLVSVLNWLVKSLKSNGTFDTGISEKSCLPTASNLKSDLFAAAFICVYKFSNVRFLSPFLVLILPISFIADFKLPPWYSFV